MDEPAAPLFEALADPTRRRVLLSLVQTGSATATQLAAAFPVTRQAVAKHLQVLSDAGLVVAERRGRETVFGFVPGSLQALSAWINAIDGESSAARWRDDVDALQRHLAQQRSRRGISQPSPSPVRIAAAARRPPPPRA